MTDGKFRLTKWTASMLTFSITKQTVHVKQNQDSCWYSVWERYGLYFVPLTWSRASLLTLILQILFITLLFTVVRRGLDVHVAFFAYYLDFLGIILLINLKVETCNPVHNNWKFLWYHALWTNTNQWLSSCFLISFNRNLLDFCNWWAF